MEEIKYIIPKKHEEEDKNYGKKAMISLAIFIVFFLLAFVTYPKPEDEVHYDYEKVSVTIDHVETKIRTQMVGSKIHHKSKYYEVTVKYNNQKYLVTVSADVYHEGYMYDMCLYNGKIYATEANLNQALVNERISIFTKLCMILGFVSIIVTVTYITMWLQNRKK